MRHHYAMPAIQPVWAKALASFLFACALALLTGCATHCLTTGLNDVYALLQQKQFVDLTHAFEPGIPHWPGFPDERRETLYWYEPGRGKLGSGFFAGEYHRVGQRGTHVDPPAHFVKGLRMVARPQDS